MSKIARHQAAAESLSLEFSKVGVELCLELKPVKNVNFRYHHPKLKVSAPKHISAEQLRVLVAGRLDWADKLYQRHVDQKNPAVKGVFSSDLRLGDRIMFWGEKRILANQGASLGFSQAGIEAALVLEVSPDANALELLQAYQRALKQSLRRRLDRRMEHWISETGLRPSQTRIKLMRSRWGSCSQRSGNISISLAIAMYDPECLDALIVHELCHLKHANHGRHFWELVYHYLPDYRRIHSRLS